MTPFGECRVQSLVLDRVPKVPCQSYVLECGLRGWVPIPLERRAAYEFVEDGERGRGRLMRRQRSGQVITVTSTAGLIGQEFCAAYAASKFALEGWMESLRFDVAPYGISTMSVEPGFFRTELLVEGSSTIWPELHVDDYAERTAQTIQAWKGMNGQQGGDPAKLARALVTVPDSGALPLRFVAGADAMAGVEENLRTIQAQLDAHRDLSASLSYDA